jgi:hypothetical protein
VNGSDNSAGYLRVAVNYLGVNVHELVCSAFHGERPSPEMIVNHIDEVRSNNSAENLEWVTHRANTIHSMGKTVLQYTLSGEFVTEFRTAGIAMNATDIREECIRQCCRGECSATGGYVWKYKGGDMAWSFLRPGRRAKRVGQYSITGALVADFDQALSAASSLKIPLKSIRGCLAGNTTTCHGFTFRYL